MGKFSKTKQYQLIQNGKFDYSLKINGAKGVYDNEIIKLLNHF